MTDCSNEGRIPIMMIRTIPLLMFLALAGGCNAAHTYLISIKNETPEPITAWLTKDGPPPESGWLPPEVLAIQSPQEIEVVGGVEVLPGKTAISLPTRGRFASGTSAMLRVYGGNLKFLDLLSISRGSSNRLDLPLKPGKNGFVIRNESGRLRAERVEFQPRADQQ